MNIQCEACSDDTSAFGRSMRGTRQFQCTRCKTPLCHLHCHPQSQSGVLCYRCHWHSEAKRWKGAKLFEPGQLEVTPAALKALGKKGPGPYLERHQAGDWGDISLKAWADNQLALEKTNTSPFGQLTRAWLFEGEDTQHIDGTVCSEYLVGWRQTRICFLTPPERRRTLVMLWQELQAR